MKLVLQFYLKLNSEQNLLIFIVLEKITKDDIVAVAKRLLSSQPAVAARGDLSKMPSLEYIQAGFLDSEGKMPSRKLSLFR